MTHEGQARRRWRPVNAGPGTGGGRPARSFLELRGAELKFGHYGLSTSKGWAMVVDGDAPFSALFSGVVRTKWNGDEVGIANYFV